MNSCEQEKGIDLFPRDDRGKTPLKTIKKYSYHYEEVEKLFEKYLPKRSIFQRLRGKMDRSPLFGGFVVAFVCLLTVGLVVFLTLGMEQVGIHYGWIESESNKTARLCLSEGYVKLQTD